MTSPNAPFVCQVCFEPRSIDGTITIAACGHRCCVPCLSHYLRTSIGEGKLSLACFHVTDATSTKPCGGLLTTAEIQSLVENDTFRKYERFEFSRKNPVFGRQCPHCEHSQVWLHGLRQRECTCEACGRSYCFTHGTAHMGRPCREFTKTSQQVSSERQSLTLINKTTKGCPGCTVAIEKEGGCNHMTCLHCGASFCWICLSLVDQTPTPQHYQGWRLGGCAGLQYANVDAFSRRYRLRRALLRGISTLAVGIPALAIAAVLTVATLGWYPILRLHGGTFSGACKGCFEVVATTIQEGYSDIGDGLVRRSDEARGGLASLFMHTKAT